MYVLDVDYHKAGKIVKHKIVSKSMTPVIKNDEIISYVTKITIALDCYREIYFTNENFQCSKEGILSENPDYLLID
jgi:hypothetical protein